MIAILSPVTFHYVANTLATTDNYQITARIDYNLSATQQIFGRE